MNSLIEREIIEEYMLVGVAGDGLLVRNAGGISSGRVWTVVFHGLMMVSEADLH